MSGLIVDLFAGGGGASIGLERALGRPVDLAVNHWREAILVHEANHPYTRHEHSDVWEVDPREAVRGQPVDVLWASPDCTYFSRARGAKPHRDRRFANRRRALASVILSWAQHTRPRVILMENVPEFEHWGPLDQDGRPDKARRGISFRRWAGRLRRLGYHVDWRQLTAADYGAHTSRRRLFVAARLDGPVEWPTITHGAPGLEPHRAAHEIVDWTLPCPTIFDPEVRRAHGLKPKLVDATMRRIAHGVKRFVIDNPEPYRVPGVLASATLVQSGYGERPGQAPRVPGLHKPLGTIVDGQKHRLVVAYMARHWGGMVGKDLRDPWPTITGKGCQDQIVTAECVPAELTPAVPFHREGEVRAFLAEYHGSGGQWADLFAPAPTVTGTDRLNLVTVAGIDHRIVDIGSRLLQPHELAAAQGFPAGYRWDIPTGEHRTLSAAGQTKRLPRTEIIQMIGNSVCADVATALVSANQSSSAVEAA